MTSVFFSPANDFTNIQPFSVHPSFCSLPCLISTFIFSYHICFIPNFASLLSVSLLKPDFLSKSPLLLQTNSLPPFLFCPPSLPIPLSLILPDRDTHMPLFLSCLSELAQAQLSRGFESQWERLGQSELFTPSDVLKRWRDQTPPLYHGTSLT